MSMRYDDENDRRKYYRIDDRIALDFTLINDPVETCEVQPQSAILFNLLADLHQAEYEAQHLLRHITERDRQLAGYLKVINKRIDLLGQALAANQLAELGEPQSVSLSEGGINFTYNQELPIGQWMMLRMVLLPQCLGLEVTAKVVHCQRHAEGVEIGAEFEGLSDAKRQLLARHILQKQALERRLAREPMDKDIL